jgi:glycosyltransferase involved in cell wall biosynthesis
MAGKRLRILHVFRAPLGGLFRHVLDVARGQIARGHEVGIFCDSSTGGARADETLEALRSDLALGLTRVPMRRAIHPYDVLAMGRLARVCRQAQPNVLHGHGAKGGAFARLVVAPDLDQNAIRAYTPHGGSFNYNPGSLAHRIFMQVEARLEPRTDAFLFESSYVAGRFKAFVGSTSQLTRVVHNGISEAEFAPVARESDPFDLLYLGELRQAKGIETLFDALALVRREHGRRLTLLVVGSGPSEPALHAHVQAAGLTDVITFAPPQPIRAALARARMMVIPSRAESLPYVILEAAAAAQPLISTNVGGIPEIFGPFADRLIPPDKPTILADRILRKLDQNEDERQSEADALAGYVRCGFSLERMVDGMISGYRAAQERRGILPLALTTATRAR